MGANGTVDMKLDVQRAAEVVALGENVARGKASWRIIRTPGLVEVGQSDRRGQFIAWPLSP